jgi:hypothetical protein
MRRVSLLGIPNQRPVYIQSRRGLASHYILLSKLVACEVIYRNDMDISIHSYSPMLKPNGAITGLQNNLAGMTGNNQNVRGLN